MAFPTTATTSGTQAAANLLNSLIAAGYTPATSLESFPGTDLLYDVVSNLLAGFPNITIGAAGTPIKQVRLYSQALTPVLITANTTAEQTFTVTGLTTTDVVNVNKPTAQAGLGIVGVRVSAANTLAITYSNNTGASITPTAAETYKIQAFTY